MPVRREITVRRPRGRTRPLWVGALALLTVAFVSAATDAAPDRKAPRIVAAALLDTDGDYRADRIRLTYSERVQHLADADGSYPFAVAGYRIRAIATPRLRTLLLTLVEKSAADDQAKPAIRYKRTDSKPVRDRAGNQAAAEAFARVKPHGNTPPPPPPPPPPVVRDGDGDGWDDTADCAPNDRSINPGAQDLPDAGFVDSNCDGIDGDERNAVFVSPAGKDENPGTKRAPKRQVQSAILAASQTGKNVYVAAGAYVPFSAETGVGIFGGYDPATWTRQGGDPRTVIEGSPQAVLVDNERGILLQFLTLRGAAGAGTAYGIRAVNGASLTLERVQVTAAEGAAGRAAAAGSRGADGSPGAAGGEGRCDGGADVSTTWGGDGGKGGAGGGRAGGNGGNGGGVNLYGASGGSAGAVGQVVGVDGGTRGSGGGSGNPGRAGANAGPGASGASGLRGSSGTNTMALAGGMWVGDPGRTGAAAAPGGGGGGGGGGGAQTGFFVRDGPGNGGGGGGAGGAAGRPGAGGAAGGGSFGVYLHNSTIVIRSSVVTAANGGAGGRGGDAGIGGNGGLGGPGARKCTSEVGAGGNGARGGDGGTGGAGGGGAGGPSIGVMKAGTSTATLSETRVTVGTGGAGGGPGALGLGAPVGGQAGIAQAIFPAP